MSKNDIAAKLITRNAQNCGPSLDKAYNNIFGLPTDSEKIVKIPLDCLHLYPNDPFKERTGEEMERLVDSIRENGLQYPIIVRPTSKAGHYEILAGRRRTNAVKQLGMGDIDAIIRNVNDDEALMIVTETNLRNREKILPSERAFAYKLQFDALKRQGRRTDLAGEPSSTQFAWKMETAQQIAENNSTSKDDIRRHIRLTYLIAPFLYLVDNELIPFIAGVNISYLDEAGQTAVHKFFFSGKCPYKLDIKASELLRDTYKKNSRLSAEEITLCMQQNEKQKNPKSFTINRSKFKKYNDKLPDDATIEQLFLEFLETRFGDS